MMSTVPKTNVDITFASPFALFNEPTDRQFLKDAPHYFVFAVG